MNSITRGYYENEPKYLKLGATVYDTRIYKTEDLTKQVINEVKNVITPNDVQRTYSNPNRNVPL